MTITSENEIEKVREYIKKNPNYKVKDIARLLMKGYVHTVKVLDVIENTLIQKDDGNVQRRT